MNKIFIKTFGCQMNTRDSEFVAGVLISDGFKIARSMESADIILFNSCSVRKHAEDRLFGNIADLKGLKKNNPDLIVGLIGCTAQSYDAKALDRSKLIDIVCGPGNESDLPRLIRSAIKKRCRIVATDKVNDKKPELFPEYREHKFKALVSIGEGCNNYCSYCIVPYVRGRERYRDIRDIVREVKDLAARGFKEVLLLGQNVNSYNGLAYSVERNANRKSLSAIRYPLNAKTSDFIRLMEELNNIKGICRIRFMTSHPKDAHEELFKAMRDLEKVCEHLHLPLQSGSDRILKLMNRGYDSKRYRKLAEQYKKILPEGSITTDIIVGFPTERDSDFEATCSIIKDIGFDSAYTFKYSPREIAKASKLGDDVPESLKSSRLRTINDMQNGISELRNRYHLDKVVEVLVEEMSDNNDPVLNGRSRSNKPVVFSGKKLLIGQLVNVEVDSITPYALKGRIVG